MCNYFTKIFVKYYEEKMTILFKFKYCQYFKLKNTLYKRIFNMFKIDIKRHITFIFTQ